MMRSVGGWLLMIMVMVILDDDYGDNDCNDYDGKEKGSGEAWAIGG